jgi:hypothetical protein
MANKSKSKKIQKIDDQEDYEKSGFKSMMEDVEKTKEKALESVPQIPREQSQVEKKPPKNYWKVVQRIKKDKKVESAIIAEFLELRPRLLGYILDVLVRTITNQPFS